MDMCKLDRDAFGNIKVRFSTFNINCIALGNWLSEI